MPCIEITRENAATLPLSDVRSMADDLGELGCPAAREIIHELIGEIERLRRRVGELEEWVATEIGDDATVATRQQSK